MVRPQERLEAEAVPVLLERGLGEKDRHERLALGRPAQARKLLCLLPQAGVDALLVAFLDSAQDSVRRRVVPAGLLVDLVRRTNQIGDRDRPVSGPGT